VGRGPFWGECEHVGDCRKFIHIHSRPLPPLAVVVQHASPADIASVCTAHLAATST
jgi:hypothetical protein